MNELVLVGVSHRTVGIELRERLALSSAHANSMLGDLAAQHPVREALALSTCGRTELYALALEPGAAEAALLRALADHGGLRPEELAGQAHVARGSEAIEHLFRVAAGLESMVLGEVEILGQLRRARELALAAGAISATTGRLVDRALAAGRLARDRTGIAAGRVSISSVAVGLAHRLLLGAGGRALVIGSGDTGTKAAKALGAAGMDVTIVAGLRPERARALAAAVGGRAVTLEGGLFEPLADADVVVSCTASPHQLVPFEVLVDVMERRRERALLVLDLALPRDFDPAARQLDGLHLHDLDDLTRAANDAANGRAAAVPEATALVTAEADRCTRWMNGLSVVPTITSLRRKSEGTVLDALRRSDLAAGADELLLRAASQKIVARLLHHPTVQLREAAEQGEGGDLAQRVQQLFALEAAGDTPDG
jgi:glutamyl-tRNA reductase